MKLFLILAIFFIGGCVTATEIYSEDGELVQSLDCSGEALTWGSCYQKAGEICSSKGYDILKQEGEDGFSVTSSYGSSTHFRTLIIACKD